MPPRKRRAPAAQESDDEENGVEVQPPRRRSNGQRRSIQDESEMQDADEVDEDLEDDEEATGVATSENQMVKNLVRMALACEHSRTPLKRSDINAKCLNGSSRQFKHIMAAAQLSLRQTFGMDIVELPAKERVTVAQRRAAQKAASQGTQSSSTNKQYILVSILPEKYRDAVIMPPSQAPDDEVEAAYIGLYTLVVALVALYGAPMPERLLERHFARMNASETTPVDRFDKVVERMTKHGYIAKIKDVSGGEETIEYIVGPRGKREVGNGGIAGLVRAVYGSSADNEQSRDLEKKLEQSLRIANLEASDSPVAEAGQTNPDGGATGRRRGRNTRQSRARDNDEDDDDDEDE